MTTETQTMISMILLGTGTPDEKAALIAAILKQMEAPATTNAQDVLRASLSVGSVPTGEPEALAAPIQKENPVMNPATPFDAPEMITPEAQAAAVRTSLHVGDYKEYTYTDMNTEQLDKAAKEIRVAMKSYTNEKRTADGGLVLWNDCPAGGAYMAYVSPFVLKLWAAGINIDKPVTYDTLSNSEHYWANSARKVMIDVITGGFSVLESNLHLYPVTDGEYKARAGYVHMTRGKLDKVNDPEMLFVFPDYNTTKLNENGILVADKTGQDYTNRTGWVALKGYGDDPKKFDLGKLFEKCPDAETFEYKTDKQGNLKVYVDKFGKNRYETKNSAEGNDMYTFRRHEVAGLISEGRIIVIKDALNKEVKKAIASERGLGESTVFLRKIGWSKLSLRQNKWDNYQASQDTHMEYTRMAPSATGIEPTIESDVVVNNVFNANFEPTKITMSEIPANFVKYMRVDIARHFPLGNSYTYLSAISLPKLVMELNNASCKEGVIFFGK